MIIYCAVHVLNISWCKHKHFVRSLKKNYKIIKVLILHKINKERKYTCTCMHKILIYCMHKNKMRAYIKYITSGTCGIDAFRCIISR